MLYGRPSEEKPHGTQIAGTPARSMGIVTSALRGCAADHALCTPEAIRLGVRVRWATPGRDLRDRRPHRPKIASHVSPTREALDRRARERYGCGCGGALPAEFGVRLDRSITARLRVRGNRIALVLRAWARTFQPGYTQVTLDHTDTRPLCDCRSRRNGVTSSRHRRGSIYSPLNCSS